MKYIENLLMMETIHYSVMNIPGLEENAIMIDSVSKRYSMCGARIGCIVSKQRAMNFAHID
jgi:aspartate aminotransferase